MIIPIEISGTTTAGGALTVTSTEAVRGLIRGVQVNLSGLDATADTTLSIQETDDEAITFLTLTNSQADAYYVPSPGAVDTSGSAITNAFPLFAVAGKFRAVVAQGGNTKAFRAVLYVDDLK